MNTKRDGRISIAFIIALAFLAAGGFFYTTKTFSSPPSTGIDYFKGKWVVTIKSNPQQAFSWTVKEDIGGGWMVGVVEKNGAKVSTDFWRQDGKKIERFAFTADGLFVRIESAGWEPNRLILVGTASDKTGETKIRETITRINDNQFTALWEREGPNGKWSVFSDEICTK